MITETVLHELHDDWGGHTIRQSDDGYILDRWSRVPGNFAWIRTLIPYCRAFPRGTDFTVWRDEYTSTAAAIFQAAAGLDAVVLSRGKLVEPIKQPEEGAP